MLFEELTPEDYPRFKPFFAHQTYPLCIYSLSSLIAWSNDLVRPYRAVNRDTLFVCAEFTQTPEDRHLILPLSPHRDFSPQELHRYAVDLGFEAYWFVPEDYLQQHTRGQVEAFFTISEQIEYADYIYRTQDLAKLAGNRYAKKRNLIRQFKRNYLSPKADSKRTRIEPITPAVAEECLAFLDRWCEERGCDPGHEMELACERQAARNAIENITVLEMQGILMRVDDVVSAFGIASHLTAQTGVLHFEKAFAGIKGLYQYFDQECAKRFFGDYEFINKESDMNIPGLVKAKKSYYPVRLVKSYRLTLR